MPDEKNTKPSSNLKSDSTGSDLPSTALDTPITPSPVPPSEQEPQTSTLAPRAMHPSAESPATTGPNAVPPGSSPASPSTRNGKKKWLIGGIIAGVLVLLIGGGVVAYFAYQNPDKVIADGFVNLFNSQPHSVKASVNAENDTVKLNATLDIKGNDKVARGTLTAKMSLKEQNLSFDGTAEIAATVDGDGYLKLNDVDTLVEKVTDAILKLQVEQYKQYGMTITDSQIKAQKEEMLKQFKPIIEKINNRWIKFKADNSNGVSEQQKCLTDAVKKLQSDKAMRDEFSKAYADNKFVNVKEQLGVKDGSYGFVLDLDKDRAKSFGNAAEKTSFFKELQKCDGFSSGISTTPTDDDSIKNMRVELWVSQWSHQITGLKMQATDTSSTQDGDTNVAFELTLGYDKADDVSVPSNAVDAETLTKEVEELLSGSSTSESNATSTTNEQEAMRESVINDYRANNRGQEPSEAEIQQMLNEYSVSNRT